MIDIYSNFIFIYGGCWFETPTTVSSDYAKVDAEHPINLSHDIASRGTCNHFKGSL